MDITMLLALNSMLKGSGGGSGGGGLSLLDMNNMDGSMYADAFPPYPDVPVLFTADANNVNGSCNFNAAQFMCFLSLPYENRGDEFRCLSLKVYVKDKLPEIKAFGRVSLLDEEYGTLQIELGFTLDGDYYMAGYQLYCDMEVQENPFEMELALIRKNGGDITHEEFFNIIDRIIVYFSLSADETIFPINTTGRGFYMNIFSEDTYAEILGDLFSSNGVGRLGTDKLYDVSSGITYNLVSDTSTPDAFWHCGVAIGQDMLIRKLTLEQWDDQGTTRYIKIVTNSGQE